MCFFEKKQQEEIDNPNPTTIETIQRYDAHIAECVASIKHVEEQIEDKKKNDAQLLLNLEVQVWKDERTIQKLASRTQELAKNLEYYKSLKEFVGLGAVGMETLSLKLEYDNVPILEMIKEVKKVSIVKGRYWILLTCCRALILLRLQHRMLLRMPCRSFE